MSDTKKEKIIGIDLGTSNSAASVLVGGKPTVVPSAEGASQYGKAFPSYVAFTDDGQMLVGEPARRQAVTNPENTISAIKRSMGTDYKVTIHGKQYSPQEISAFILQKIKLNNIINNTRVTFPNKKRGVEVLHSLYYTSMIDLLFFYAGLMIKQSINFQLKHSLSNLFYLQYILPKYSIHLRAFL